jgi:hypothetical protein
VKRESVAKNEQPPDRENTRETTAIGHVTSGIAIGPASQATVYTYDLAEADPGDVQKIAASQIDLLTSYYNAVLGQATMSFRWALVATGIGLCFFILAITFLLVTQSQAVATISVISGALVEVIAGINFHLYNKTTTQLSNFHQHLDQTQRFLLANSICEALEGETKQATRAAIVNTIANPQLKP